MSSGCSPRFLISFDDRLPGLASAISVTALFKPIEKISSAVSRVADLFAHFTYGPNLPLLRDIFSLFSGYFPNILGKLDKNFALSRSMSFGDIPLGIEKFLPSSSLFPTCK